MPSRFLKEKYNEVLKKPGTRFRLRGREKAIWELCGPLQLLLSMLAFIVLVTGLVLLGYWNLFVCLVVIALLITSLVVWGIFNIKKRKTFYNRELVSTEKPLKTVAAELGFTDASHLNNSFKMFYGSTPSQYRKKHRSV